MNEWMAYFCAGCLMVSLCLTLVNLKLFTEFVKDKLQDARKAGSSQGK